MKRLFVLFFIGLLLLIKVPFVSASELSNNGSPYCPQYANVAYKPDLQKYQVCYSAAPKLAEAQQTFHLGDDPKIRDICESSGFLTVLHMVLIIVNILKLAVPLVLIGMLTMDIYPLIGNPGEVSKVVKKSKNRLIAAILIFFVPTIMQIILNALGDSTTVSTCYDHATDTGYIEDRKNAEKAYFKGNTSSSSQNGGSNNGNSGGGSTWRSDDDGGFNSRSGKF